MKTTIILAAALAGSTSLFTLASGCSGGASDSDVSSSSSSGGTTSGGTTSGGTTSGGNGTSSIDRCGNSTSGNNNCSKEELDAYTNCSLDKCAANYKECYGPDFMSGTVSGSCEAMVTCSKNCDCNDTACLQKCTPDQACKDCSTKLGQCITSNCTLPACYGGGTAGAKTCADLAACCAKITDSTKKTQCDTTYNAIKGSGDITCNGVYTGYAADCP